MCFRTPTAELLLSRNVTLYLDVRSSSCDKRLSAYTQVRISHLPLVFSSILFRFLPKPDATRWLNAETSHLPNHPFWVSPFFTFQVSRQKTRDEQCPQRQQHALDTPEFEVSNYRKVNLIVQQRLPTVLSRTYVRHTYDRVHTMYAVHEMAEPCTNIRFLRRHSLCSWKVYVSLLVPIYANKIGYCNSKAIGR